MKSLLNTLILRNANYRMYSVVYNNHKETIKMIKKTINVMLALVLCVSFSTPAFAAEQPSSWALGQVNEAIAARIVPLSLQSRYTQTITRAEFSALGVALYENLKGEITERITFVDTNDVNVEKMAAVGVVSGVGNNSFAPNDTLTREQAAVMLSNLARVLDHPLTPSPPDFTDNTLISPWAYEFVGKVQRARIMSGVGDGKFDPWGAYTREQSIVTILRLSNEFDLGAAYYESGKAIEIDLSAQDITNQQLAEKIASGEIPANVTKLDLKINSISDISPLSKLTNLTYLDLWGNEVNDVSPLKNLTNLTDLILWGNRFDDISSLDNLTNIVRLSIGDNPQFNGDLSVIRNFVKLTDLGLGGTDQMDFSPLETLVNLERLQLWGACQLDDLSIIGNLRNLTNLTINGANIKDFAPLSNLTNLTRLDLQGLHISQENIDKIKESLPNTQITIG